MKRGQTRADLLCGRLGALITFLAALVTYLLTIAPSASFWDCPEYIVSGSLLEPGHPPGNPVWMLAAKVATVFAPSAEYVALAINVTSAIFTALAAMILFVSLWMIAGHLVPRAGAWMRLLASFCGAAAFMWSDTAWFSAVEAEVYAFSIFLTALMFWVALVAARHYRRRRLGAAQRWVVLEAYLCGLSLGVHQLNLLLLPAVMLLWLFALREKVSRTRILLTLLLSFLVVGAVLFLLVPGMLHGAGWTELLFANTLRLPMHVGTIAFFLLVAVALALCLSLCRSAGTRLMLWCLAMVLVGLSSFALIYIRGMAGTPLNTGAPGNIFALRSYMQRDQYGSHPLLYGPTPYSSRMRAEKPIEGDTLNCDYSSYYMERGERIYAPRRPGALPPGYGMLTDEDRRAYADTARGYVLTRYMPVYRTQPELNMLLPRIFSSDPADMSAYRDWTSMTDDNMQVVAVSEAVDSVGRDVYKLVDGKRTPGTAKRPTYLHHAEYLFGYQLSYMYLRYLGWNFIGRQNDMPSQGAADTGNFITGLEPLDALMIGPQKRLPDPLSRDNAGRNIYFALPFLLGILGIALLFTTGRAGRRAFVVLFTLFVMTGIAIVVYLNQTPGEPRERDYSFVGSIYAFCFWIGLGVMQIWRMMQRVRAPWGAVTASVVGLGTVGWMCAENWVEHDRSGLTMPRDYAYNLLHSTTPDAILFVDGDNYTFPVWYAQEVEGERQDVRVVCLAYLSSPYYIREILTPGRTGATIPFHGRADYYDYGALRTATFLSTPGASMDALQALDSLYADVMRSQKPRFRASRLRIPARESGQDSLVIDLAKLAGGGRSIIQRDIAMIDIVATNANSGWPRDIYWPGAILDNKKLCLTPHLARIGQLQRLSPYAVTDPLETYRLAMQTYRYGIDPQRARYIDPNSASIAEGWRQTLVATALQLLRQGDTDKALQLARLTEQKFPSRLLTSNTTTRDMVPFNSEVELARIYAAAGDTAHARQLLRPHLRTAIQYKIYWDRLPAWRRHAFSSGFHMRAQTWFYPYDVWLSLGFEPEKDWPVYDVAAERSKFEKDYLQRQLTASARQAADLAAAGRPDTLTARRLRRFYTLGGSRDDLTRYREFDQFPFTIYEQP